MTNATLIGTGAMGSALARALLARQHTVTVWNRTAGKTDAVVREGARRAADLAAAVAASPVVVVCVTDYAASHALLDGVDLTGKFLVQLSTGTPRDARDGEAWATARGARYLDGAILAVPSQIGGPESAIFVSGSSAAWSAGEPLLRAMAGTVSYLGDGAGAASAFDLGFLSTLFGALLGLYHGARVLESEGLRVDALGDLLVALAPGIGQVLHQGTTSIHSGNYAGPESSLEICWLGMVLLARQAREASLDGTFPDFASALFQRGMDAGLGAEAPGALVKVLRTPQVAP